MLRIWVEHYLTCIAHSGIDIILADMLLARTGRGA